MEYKEYQGKNLDEAITNACVDLGITADRLDYEVVDKGSGGFLGLGSKPAVISAKKRGSADDIARAFLEKVLAAMGVSATINIKTQEDGQDREINIDLSGEGMGVLIGKRGQTLDSLQYLVSLAVNKQSDTYYKVKLDTENYRERRKATLENLAKNVAAKVARIRRPVALEPMNPYERRIIHSALQGDPYCTTRSEGDEPYRHVVVLPKRGS